MGSPSSSRWVSHALLSRSAASWSRGDVLLRQSAQSPTSASAASVFSSDALSSSFAFDFRDVRGTSSMSRVLPSRLPSETCGHLARQPRISASVRARSATLLKPLIPLRQVRVKKSKQCLLRHLLAQEDVHRIARGGLAGRALHRRRGLGADRRTSKRALVSAPGVSTNFSSPQFRSARRTGSYRAARVIFRHLPATAERHRRHFDRLFVDLLYRRTGRENPDVLQYQLAPLLGFRTVTAPLSGLPAIKTSTRLFGVMNPLTPVTVSTLTDIAHIPSVMIDASKPAPGVMRTAFTTGWFFAIVVRAIDPTTACGSLIAPSRLHAGRPGVPSVPDWRRFSSRSGCCRWRPRCRWWRYACRHGARFELIPLRAQIPIHDRGRRKLGRRWRALVSFRPPHDPSPPWRLPPFVPESHRTRDCQTQVPPPTAARTYTGQADRT